jgi:hypothetical protein
MSDPSEKPEDRLERPDSDQEGERLVLAAAEAIRNLVADRRSLRETVAAQERELIRVRANNAELWRHVGLIRDSYRRLATEFFTQLQRMDSAIGATVPAEFRTGSTQELVNPLANKPNEDSDVTKV